MNPIIKAIKVAVLKRQTLELYGKIKYWSKMVKGWEYRCTMISTGRASGFLTQRDFNEMQGSIKFYTLKIKIWQLDYYEKCEQLRELGVIVELKL